MIKSNKYYILQETLLQEKSRGTDYKFHLKSTVSKFYVLVNGQSYPVVKVTHALSSVVLFVCPDSQDRSLCQVLLYYQIQHFRTNILVSLDLQKKRQTNDVKE